MAETLAAILPPGAVAVERGTVRGAAARASVPELYRDEEELVAGASDGRRREFAEARACARQALNALRVTAGAIPAGSDGAPLWPRGIVGSITHKGGYRAAVVARSDDLAGIGIDAEPDERLPEGVLETIASARELDQVESLLARRPGPAWDRLLFSAKEASVKSLAPLGGRVAGPRAVEVRFGTREGCFSASADVRERESPAIRGAWASRSGLLLTVAYVANAPSKV